MPELPNQAMLMGSARAAIDLALTPFPVGQIAVTGIPEEDRAKLSTKEMQWDYVRSYNKEILSIPKESDTYGYK